MSCHPQTNHHRPTSHVPLLQCEKVITIIVFRFFYFIYICIFICFWIYTRIRLGLAQKLMDQAAQSMVEAFDAVSVFTRFQKKEHALIHVLFLLLWFFIICSFPYWLTPMQHWVIYQPIVHTTLQILQRSTIKLSRNILILKEWFGLHRIFLNFPFVDFTFVTHIKVLQLPYCLGQPSIFNTKSPLD